MGLQRVWHNLATEQQDSPQIEEDGVVQVDVDIWGFISWSLNPKKKTRLPGVGAENLKDRNMKQSGLRKE